MGKILCSTGAFLGKANNNDYRLLKYYADQLECDGFELLISKSWYPEMDEVIKTIRSFGLTIPVVHANKSLGEYLCGMTASFEDGQYKEYIMTNREEEELFERGTALFLQNLKAAEQLGAEKMVLHLWNGIPSDKRIENNIRRFGTWREYAVKAGVDLLVENVVCNEKDPLFNMDLVSREYDQVGFVYDTKMAEFHDQTMELFDERYVHFVENGQIRHLHVNDYAGGYKDWDNLKIPPIGSGHVNFQGFFEKLLSYGYDGDYTVELNAIDKDGNVNTAVLNRCFEKIRELCGQKS